MICLRVHHCACLACARPACAWLACARAACARPASCCAACCCKKTCSQGIIFSLCSNTTLIHFVSFQNCFQHQIREKKMIHQGSLENAVHNLFPHQCMCNKDTLSLHLNLLLYSPYCSDENECKKGSNDNQSNNWLFPGIRCVASQHHLMLRISGTSHPYPLLSSLLYPH